MSSSMNGSRNFVPYRQPIDVSLPSTATASLDTPPNSEMHDAMPAIHPLPRIPFTLIPPRPKRPRNENVLVRRRGVFDEFGDCIRVGNHHYVRCTFHHHRFPGRGALRHEGLRR